MIYLTDPVVWDILDFVLVEEVGAFYFGNDIEPYFLHKCGRFCFSVVPPLTVTPDEDQSLEFNPRKPGTTMTYVNQRMKSLNTFSMHRSIKLQKINVIFEPVLWVDFFEFLLIYKPTSLKNTL